MSLIEFPVQFPLVLPSVLLKTFVDLNCLEREIRAVRNWVVETPNLHCPGASARLGVPSGQIRSCKLRLAFLSQAERMSRQGPLPTGSLLRYSIVLALEYFQLQQLLALV